MTPPSGKRVRARLRSPADRAHPAARDHHGGYARRARSHGQALVELAIILPILLFLLLGALDLGRVYYANITVSSAAKEAALNASSGSANPAAAAVNESRGGFVTVAAGDVTTVYSDSTNECSDAASFGATVTATVDAQFQSITPMDRRGAGRSDRRPHRHRDRALRGAADDAPGWPRRRAPRRLRGRRQRRGRRRHRARHRRQRIRLRLQCRCARFPTYSTSGRTALPRSGPAPALPGRSTFLPGSGNYRIKTQTLPPGPFPVHVLDHGRAMTTREAASRSRPGPGRVLARASRSFSSC